MNWNQWIDAEKGRAAIAARHFDVTEAAVSQWRDNGVPVGRMRAVCEFTEHEVTVDDLVAERDAAKAAKASEQEAHQ